MMSTHVNSLRFLAVTVALLTTATVVSPALTAPKTIRTSATYTREYQVADQALQTGRYTMAETQLNALLKKNPHNTAARSALSLAQAELFKLDPAEKNARQVLAKDPKNAMAHATLGVVARNRTASLDMDYKSRRDELLAQSAAELEQATRLNSRSPEIQNQLGVTYRFQGRYAEAQQRFETALRLDPHFAEALVNQGVSKFEQGDIAGAKTLYQQAIRLNSKNQTAHYRLGEAYLKEGNGHLAYQTLNNALALSPGNAAILCKMAEANEFQGNTAAAVANYQKAIQANPGFMPAYIGQADIYDNRGDGELAMATLRSGLNVNPRYSRARNQLGHLALTVDKPDQALQYFKESLQQNPNDPEALQGMSQALMVVAQKTSQTSQFSGQDSNLTDAEQAVEEALRLNPNDLRLHLAHLRISQLSGKPAASEAELQRIVGVPAQNEPQRMLQGEALMALGRYQESDEVFRELMTRAGNDTDKLLTIGDTLKANNDLFMAREAYQKVRAISPNNLKADRALSRIDAADADAQKSYRLAKSLNHFWQKQSALDFYEETLSKNPRQPEARLALAKLYEKYKRFDKAAHSYQLYLGLMPTLPEDDRRHIERKISKMQELAQKPAN